MTDTKWGHLEDAERKELQKKIQRLRAALTDLFVMMDEGVLVRDISGDAKPDYVTRMLKFVKRLAAAKQALGESDE